MTAPGDWFSLFDRYGGVIACLLGVLYLIMTGRLYLSREYQRIADENTALKAKLEKVDVTLQESAHTMHQVIGAALKRDG